jgi:tRNA modification GTPase
LFGASGPAWLAELGRFQRVFISALTREGMDELERCVRERVTEGGQPLWESTLITNARQKQAAARALGAAEDALGTIRAGRGDELLAVDLARVLDALGDIVGETTAEDLLDRIFAGFCIGK